MRLETKTVTILMCVALALSACSKKTITPAVDPQPAEVGFTAASQATLVKSDTKDTTPLSNIHPDFGVWGIARQEINPDYILWDENGLTQVTKPSGSDVYVPVSPAYWLKGYTYNFLAVAPYNAAGLSNVNFTLTNTSGNTTGKDYMTFTYDMSDNYDAGNYSFDLLGAAAQKPVTTGGYDEPQQLVFWHLLSQIEIKNIGFASGINGRVDKIVLRTFPSAVYTISHDNSSDNRTKPTGIACDEITVKNDGEPADKSEITFTNPNFSVFHPIINIIPQAVANLELYIDFTITQDTITDEYKGFKINLNAQELTEYVYNGKYNWNITIGTRNAITFDVSVTPWQDAIVPGEYPLS